MKSVLIMTIASCIIGACLFLSLVWDPYQAGPQRAEGIVVEVDPQASGIPISPGLFGVSTMTMTHRQIYDTRLEQASRNIGIKSMRIQSGSPVGKRFLVRVTDGICHLLATDDTPYTPGQKIKVSVFTKGQKIRIKIDDKVAFDVKDPTYKQGRIGVFSVANEDSYFQAPKVCKLPCNQPESMQLVGKNGFVNRLEKPIESASKWESWHTDDTTLYEESQVAYTSYRVALSPRRPSYANAKLEFVLKSNSIAPRGPLGPHYQGYIGIMFRASDWRNGYRLYLGSPFNPLLHTNNPWRADDYQFALSFAQRIHAAPSLVLNFPKIAPADALQLVQNLPKAQTQIPLYVELGNEIADVQPGDPSPPADHQVPPNALAISVKPFVEAIKKSNPEARLCIPLPDGYQRSGRQYLETLINKASQQIECLAFHLYPGGGFTPEYKLAVAHAVMTNYRTTFGAGKGLFDRIRQKLRQKMSAEQVEQVDLIVSEYQLQGTDMTNGVATADLLGVLAAQKVKLAQLHGLGADPTGWAPFDASRQPYPVGLAIKLMEQALGTTYLPSKVVGAGVYAIPANQLIPEMKSVPLIAAHAGKSAQGVLSIVLINRDLDRSHRVQLRIRGIKNRAQKLTVLRLKQINMGANQAGSTINKKEMLADLTNWKLELPPISVSVVQLN